MRTQEVAIKSTPLRVILKPDAEVLQEVVVTGMQKMDKRLFTGAADQLAAANVKIDGMPEISRALEGRSAGVSVQNVSRYVRYCSEDSRSWSYFHLRKFQTVVGC